MSVNSLHNCVHGWWDNGNKGEKPHGVLTNKRGYFLREETMRVIVSLGLLSQSILVRKFNSYFFQGSEN